MDILTKEAFWTLAEWGSVTLIMIACQEMFHTMR